MRFIAILLAAAVVFGICAIVDKLFTRLFRSRAQHRSGLAVRASKRYGIFGVMLIILGILGIINGGTDKVLFFGGITVLLMGGGLAVHYLSYGVFYDGETFLVCRFARKSQEHTYREIASQKLYALTGGGTVIELTLTDGTTVSLQSSMEGVYPFMDTAFAGWCMQTGHKMEQCSFYDPAKSWWFPHEEAV